MKNKIIFLVALLCLTMFAFAGCGTFEGFDDDNTIINSRSSTSIGSFESDTPSQFIFNCSNFNGVKIIKNITVPQNPKFSMTLNIDSGRFKIVLVKDNTVYVITESNTDSSVSVTLPAGTYSLRVVGEDAKMQFKFSYNSYN